jgi:hypothetical protein
MKTNDLVVCTNGVYRGIVGIIISDIGLTKTVHLTNGVIVGIYEQNLRLL